jgi:hypothetical protein
LVARIPFREIEPWVIDGAICGVDSRACTGLGQSSVERSISIGRAGNESGFIKSNASISNRTAEMASYPFGAATLLRSPWNLYKSTRHPLVLFPVP